MVRTHTRYKLAMVVWALATFGAGILVFTGTAAPVVSPERLPGGLPAAAGGTVAAFAAGSYAIDRVRARDWRATGAAAGLARADGGLLWGEADLTSTVHGRTVRARTKERTKSSGGSQGGQRSVTYTVLEADLADPATDGLLLGRTRPDSEAAPGDGLETLGGEFGGLSTVALDDGFWAVADDEALAAALVTDRVRDAASDLGSVEAVYVGDAGGVLTDAVEDAMGSGLAGTVAGSVAGMVADTLAGDATTVSYESRGMLLDAGEMARRARMVAAVADAFEDATREGW